MTTIALVDDDRNILTSLALALEAEGYVVRTYKDGEEGLNGLQTSLPDLAILDVKMPRLDGFEVIARLREVSALPVIFLTSKDDEVDEVLGLRLGADDYITKPFSQRLLLERIRAVLRRHAQEGTPGEDKKPACTTVSCGALVMDDERYTVTWQSRGIDVTVTEFMLLRTLVERPGVVKTRDQLIDQAYGESVYVDDRTIDSHIKRLRKKFKMIDENFNHIETLYGAGYRYQP